MLGIIDDLPAWLVTAGALGGVAIVFFTLAVIEQSRRDRESFHSRDV